MRTYSATMLMLLPLAFAEQPLPPRPRLRKGQAAPSKTQRDGMAVVADVGGVMVDGEMNVGSRRRRDDEAVIVVPVVGRVVPVVGAADPIVVTDVEATKDITTYPEGRATYGGSHGSASWPGSSTGWANKREEMDDNTDSETSVVAGAKVAKDTTTYPGGEATYGGSHGSASWPGGATGWANKGQKDMDNNTEIEASVVEGKKDTTTYPKGQATYGGSHGSASWAGGSTAWANKVEDMDDNTEPEASVVAVDKDTTTLKKSMGSGDVKAADPAHA